jgi:hypothetical protein
VCVCVWKGFSCISSGSNGETLCILHSAQPSCLTKAIIQLRMHPNVPMRYYRRSFHPPELTYGTENVRETKRETNVSIITTFTILVLLRMVFPRCTQMCSPMAFKDCTVTGPDVTVAGAELCVSPTSLYRKQNENKHTYYANQRHHRQRN